MPAISSINARQAGAFNAAPVTLTASDTITFDPRSKQLMVVRAPGTPVTLTIDGADGTTVTKPGVGPINVAGGFSITIPANESRAVVLSTISDYCQGVVTLTGAAGAFLQLFNL